MSLTEKSAEAEAHTREIAENRRRLEELIQENKRTKGESEKKYLGLVLHLRLSFGSRNHLCVIAQWFEVCLLC